MNMFKPTAAKDRDSYFACIDEPRRSQIVALDLVIQKAVPSLKPNFLYNMPGYGTFKYQNYKKEIIDWPVVALASQKNYISIYVCSMINGKYLAEIYKNKLGRVSIGKSCIRFKKIDDLNMAALRDLLKEAAKKPGLTF